MSDSGKSMSDEEAFGPRPENGHQLAPHADTTPTAPTGQALTDEQAFGPRGSEQRPGGFIHGAMDLGAAAWADFARRDDTNNSGSSMPALDNYFQSTPAGQMLKQFGQDTTAPFSAMTSLATMEEGMGLDFLKRTGDLEAWKKNHTATTDYFRNSALRPAATIAADDMRDTLHQAKAALSYVPYFWGQYGDSIVGSLSQLRSDITNQKESADTSQFKDLPPLSKAMAYIHHWAMGLNPGDTPRIAVEMFDVMGAVAALTGIPALFQTGAHAIATATVNMMPPPGGPAEKQKAIEDQERKLGDLIMLVGPEGTPMVRAANMARRLDAARKAGVIGKPPLFTDTGMDIKAAQQKAQAADKAAGVEPPVERPAGVPEPNLEASPPPPVDEGRPPVEAPQRDVHGVAREMAPDLFTQYDPLAARHQWYNDWINELRANRNQDPRLQRAQAEIDGIMAKVGGVESRLTNRQRTQIEDIRGGMHDFLNTDTPDMARVKEAMLENYQLMAPLQAEVQAAYRSAADRMGAEAEAQGEHSPIETAPAPEPEPDVHYPAPENESAPQPVNQSVEPGTPFVPPAAGNETPPFHFRELPAETGHIQTTADVAADVSRQLQAAGRPKEEADAQAQLIASHYEARAARFRGARGTGADLYRAEGPAIQGVGRPARGQRTFAQRAVQGIKEIASKVPGLSRILPDLTDAERGAMTTRAAQSLVDMFGKLPKAKEVAAVAYSGRAKRGWYRNAAQSIHQLFGADSDRFSALLAAMSPQTSVESNLANALKTWTNWVKEGRPTDPAAIKNIMGRSVEGTGGEASVLDAWVNNSIRALTHDDPGAMQLSGPKVSSFMHNLRGAVDEVTNDAWMATYAALDPETFASRRLDNKVDTIGKSFGFKSPGYMAMSATIRRAARILTEQTGEAWTPAEVQETVWSWAKALYERRDRAGEDRTVQQILKAGDLTHEDVAGASDFASLLIRGIYSKILEEGGYGSELDTVRRAADERAAAGGPTGPAVSVTGAEGSGFAQPAFERHLRQAGERLESVRAARLAEQGVSPRDMAKAASKSELAANMSATTPTIPGIQKLADAANAGDVSAGHLVNLIAHDSLTRLMSGIPGVKLETTSNGGLYGGSLEPSLGVGVTFPVKHRGPVLAALAKFAENFNQEQIHVRQMVNEEPGRVFTDGSYATPVYRIELKTPLTRDEIQKHIDASGLYGLTFNDDAVEAYYVGNPRDRNAREEFIENVKKLDQSLGEGAGGIRRGVARLWAYGHGDGATHGYDAIAGELPAGTEQHTQIPRALAERELGHEVTPAEQAAEITPEQRKLQEHIARNYEDLPDNDLENPLVARAYDALTRVIGKQYASLPIKVEAWAERQPDGSWAPKGGEPYHNSAGMREDVLRNNHLYFFITDKDQFGPPGADFSGHPLLKPAGVNTTNGYPMLQNDVLRVVHDYYAHNMSPVAFGPKGEEAAWRNHTATIDDPWARWALTTETRGQNSWVNFGAHVDPASGLSERPFARQKAALLPIEDSMTGDDYVDLPMLELQRELTARQSEGSLHDTMFQSGDQQPIFYSALARSIEELPQGKASAGEWSNIIDNLRGKGVKQEEIDWSGVKDWLAGRKGPVSKADLLEQLRENAVDIQEVTRGAGRTPEHLALTQKLREAIKADAPDEEIAQLMDRKNELDRAESPEPKYKQYALPGGQNYRELLLTLPEKQGARGPKGWGDTHGGTSDTANYRSGHWDEPNVLAHIRFDDRTGPDGEKILHMAEVQSDWHQAGRRKGYAASPREVETLRADARGLEKELSTRDIRAADTGDTNWIDSPERRALLSKIGNIRHRAAGGGILDAPFKTSWHELALKRMLRYAAENGYDKLSWDTGAANADRYSLRKQVDALSYIKKSDGTYTIRVEHKGSNNSSILGEEIRDSELPNLVGKEMADKIILDHGRNIPNSQAREFRGIDLEVGGEGMKGFYDKILPSAANKLGKKFGAKVEDGQISQRGATDTGVTGRKHPYGLVSEADGSDEYRIYRTANDETLPGTYRNREEAERAIANLLRQEEEGTAVHSIPITDAMRDSVMQGQPMFQPNRGAITFKKGAAPTIRLMANADASTFLHETGHAWLEELMADAGHAQAPVQLQHDAAITRAWLGVGEGEAIPRAAHEKWARGFERYLMEGIAPTRELASVFARFKQWLVRIYKTATSLRSPINDDIRGVFDRLVASPDQPTIIAEPRNTARVMADMHEVEAGSTPPHLAGATADAIDREVETQLRRVAPEEHDALLRSELEGGAEQKPGAPPAGRLHEAKPLPGPTSGNAAAGPLAAGEHELAPASSQLRAAAGGTGGAAAGEQGLGLAEPVEARLARRLAGRSAGPDIGGGRGLEVPGTGPMVPSQLGLNVQARAIAAGMPDATVGEVLEHAQLSKAEQSELAAQLLAENRPKAKAIAMGQQPSPHGLMSIFVYRAVEADARAAKDWATINELTKSKILNSVTDAGRILNALADQDPSSPLAAMKSVVKARENAITLGQKGIDPNLSPAEQARIGEATTRADDALADWKAHGMDPNDMPRRLAYGRAQMDVVKTIESMKPGQPFWSWNTLWNVWGVPKSLLTSIFHFSAPFVQGRGLIATSYWWKGFAQMYRYFGSEDAYLDNNAWIATHPDYELLKQGKVSIGKLGNKVSEREEAIQSSLVEQASHYLSENTGIPDLVRASSRAFSGYINYIRASYFYDLVAAARAAGEDLGPKSHAVRDIGNMINDFTGRGNIGVDDKYGNISPAANMVFFTVRKISGTMNMFNPERYLNPSLSKTARTAAVKQLMGHVATTASVLGLAKAVGLDINMDPDSSDFLMLKIGDTSFDLSGGSITYARMWARMAKWGWNHYIEGETGKGFNRTAADDVGQYFRNSLAPTSGFIADALYGKDPAGRPFEISDELSDKLVPITIGEVIDFAAYDGQNYAAMLPALTGIFGVRVKTPLAPKDMMGMNVWGEPTEHFSKPLNSAVDQELKQIGYNMGFAGPSIQGVKLTTLQRQAFIQVSGRMAFENIQNDMSLPGWADYPKEEKLRMVRSDVAAARRDAADQIMSEDMTTAAPGESIMDKATKIKNAQYGIDQ